MNTLGVILARRGSIGLPNKHLLPLLGRPVISYTFDHASAAAQLTRTIVSTDCPEIRRLALSAGFEAIHRPDHLATADASVQDVMLHALESVERTSDFRADALVVLYGNVPIRGDGVIDRALTHLQSSGADSVRTFCPVGKWHPMWMLQFDGDRLHPYGQPGQQAASIHRRQDLTPAFLHDGAVVAVTRASMLRGQANPADPHAFFGTDRRGIHTAMGETIEIDHLRDLYWAEAVLRERTTLAAETAIPPIQRRRAS